METFGSRPLDLLQEFAYDTSLQPLAGVRNRVIHCSRYLPLSSNTDPPDLNLQLPQELRT